MSNDEFDESTDEVSEGSGRMSFLEHLEELRKRIIYSLYGVIGGCVLSFWFAVDLTHYLERYLTKFGGKLIYTELTGGFMFYFKVGGLADMVGALLGRAPVMVPCSGKPFHVGLMTAPDCHDGYLGLLSENTKFRNEVAARFALKILTYRPGALAGRIPCPAFFAVCSRDSVAPSGPTLRHVRHARRGEIKVYDTGHFDIYVGAHFEQVVADQIAFLRKNVPLA